MVPTVSASDRTNSLSWETQSGPSVGAPSRTGSASDEHKRPSDPTPGQGHPPALSRPTRPLALARLFLLLPVLFLAQWLPLGRAHSSFLTFSIPGFFLRPS